MQVGGGLGQTVSKCHLEGTNSEQAPGSWHREPLQLPSDFSWDPQPDAGLQNMRTVGNS